MEPGLQAGICPNCGLAVLIGRHSGHESRDPGDLLGWRMFVHLAPEGNQCRSYGSSPSAFAQLSPALRQVNKLMLAIQEEGDEAVRETMTKGLYIFLSRRGSQSTVEELRSDAQHHIRSAERLVELIDALTTS